MYALCFSNLSSRSVEIIKDAFNVWAITSTIKYLNINYFALKTIEISYKHTVFLSTYPTYLTIPILPTWISNVYSKRVIQITKFISSIQIWVGDSYAKAFLSSQCSAKTCAKLKYFFTYNFILIKWPYDLWLYFNWTDKYLSCPSKFELYFIYLNNSKLNSYAFDSIVYKRVFNVTLTAAISCWIGTFICLRKLVWIFSMTHSVICFE